MAYTTLRVFRVTFYCDECPNEWTDEMLTVSHSWCPCCDMKCEPGTIDRWSGPAGWLDTSPARFG